MARLKKGNVFEHAKTGVKVRFKKPAVKKPVAKKAVRRVAAKRPAPVPRTAIKPHFKFTLHVQKTPTSKWEPVGIGGSNLEAVKGVARIYASNYPTYGFKVE